MPPKKKKKAKKVEVKPNLGDIPVNFTKPEKVEVAELVETPIFESVVKLANGGLVGLILINETADNFENEVLYQKGQIQDSGLIEWSPQVKMPEETFKKFIDGAEPFKLPKSKSESDSAPVEIIIPDGVVELKNKCLVEVIGRTDGERIQYRKGWRKDTGLIEWSPPASMLKEMFNKFIKQKGVKE